jgi:transketolase
LRTVPNLVTIRPADATETVEAWKVAMERRHGPTALVLSRQSLPLLDRGTLNPETGLHRGGYILWQASESPEAIIIGTGSEVHIALEAGGMLKNDGIAARIVSLPSWELFDAQPPDYRSQVLPASVRVRLSIEAGTPLGWERYVGLDGMAVGLSRFGASAPGRVVYERLGLTAERLRNEVVRILEGGNCRGPAT